MPQDRLQMMLEMQHELQLKMKPVGRDPATLRDDEMAVFITWNMFALEDELHEAMQEIGWKPWATSRHINWELFLGEMVDAFHFFMNTLLCAGQGRTPAEIVDAFTKAYLVKNAENARRQQEGYDGVKEKCKICGRETNTDGICIVHGEVLSI